MNVTKRDVYRPIDSKRRWQRLEQVPRVLLIAMSTAQSAQKSEKTACADTKTGHENLR
jgi:hypothetical protein